MFQRFYLDHFNGTVLSDGVFTFCENPYLIPDKLFRNTLFRFRSRIIPHTLPINVLVVDFNGKRIMVDTGAYVPPALRVPEIANSGKLSESMAMAGISPLSIDIILLTHGHADHVLGMVSPDGTSSFPNADVYISKIDHEFWVSPSNNTILDPEIVGKLASRTFMLS